MIYCINSNCSKPENPDGQTYCITCGIKLVRTPAPTSTPTSSTRRNFITRASSSIVAVSIYGGLNKYIFSSPSFATSKPSPEASPEASTGSKISTNLQSFDFETVTVDVRGNITNRQRRQAQFISEDLGSGAILDMIAIPGGSFVMGSPNTEAGRSDYEGPQRTVSISPFFMGKYEVTQEQYQAVMGNNPSNFKGAKHPVEKVNWNDAVEFCRKLSQKTGKTYRLPSEAEWEYACRAGTTTPFYFGETITPDLVNYDGNYPYASAQSGLYRQQTTDVGSFGPNLFGLYDMHGQVWEWCSDRYHDNYNGAPTDGSSWETGTNDNRVLRGGSWDLNAVFCRSAYRVWVSAGFRWWFGGFRVAIASVSPSS
jgi:formylglycine-generating enzyme required for sulfatase activity